MTAAQFAKDIPEGAQGTVLNSLDKVNVVVIVMVGRSSAVPDFIHRSEEPLVASNQISDDFGRPSTSLCDM